jgi:small-conductance mechanosensitive channel
MGIAHTGVEFDYGLLTVWDDFRDKLNAAWDQVVQIGGAILIAVIVLIISRYLVRWLRRFVWRRVPITEVTPATESLVNNSISAVVYFAAMTIILGLWGASWEALLTAVSLSTLAVVIGLQDLLRSILGGAFIVAERPFEIGDRIRVRDLSGEVADIKLRTTILRTDDGLRLSMPNSLHLSEPITNLDRPISTSSVLTVFGLEGNPEEIELMVKSALAGEPPISATVRVIGRQGGWISKLLRIGESVLPGAPDGASEGEANVHVRIVLSATKNPRLTEQEAVDRIERLFPDADIMVRRGSILTQSRR